MPSPMPSPPTPSPDTILTPTEHFEENLRILFILCPSPISPVRVWKRSRGIIGQEIGMIEDNPE